MRANEWNPYWQANTAYVATAVVVPTATNYLTGTFAGYTWRCTTAGTSGPTEPTWPTNPSITPTVTDGGVTWSVGTGFRQAIEAGLGGLVGPFITANPTIIRSFRGVRPRSLTTADLPCFFIGDLNEEVATANGVRTRVVTGFSCWLADDIGEQLESSTRQNFVVDALTDLFSTGIHMISGRSNFQHTATNDAPIGDGIIPFAGTEFVFGRTSVAEGRD